MADDNNDIIPTDPEKNLPRLLEKHLHGVIPESDLHKFQEQLPADFLADASEGLHHVRDTSQLDSVLKKINQQMHHQLGHKKTHKKWRSAGNLTSTYWAITIIIILAIIGFVIVRMLLYAGGR